MNVETITDVIADVVGEKLAEIQRAQSQIAAAFVQVDGRIKSLEARPPIQGEKGADGKDAPPVDELSIASRIEQSLKSVIAGMIDEAVAAHMKASPPQPGKDGRDGADVDMVQVKAMIEDAVRAIPAPKDGKDGADGKDGRDGSDGKDGERGEKGADGLGVADLMIDRDGALVATMTDGRIKSLGPVVGKDGRDGQDGKDGIGLDAFELEYLDETHEVRIKAACGGRVKEIRYPAGGIRPGGYWREGIKAKCGEVWVEGGTSYVCNVDTTTKPEGKSADWTILARKGRDGETVVKTVRDGPPAPIKLKD